MDALQQFDAKNAARRMSDFADRRDSTAHYRHTLALAEESVEQIRVLRETDERLGTEVERFMFLGERFATHEDAEAARREHILGKAREFYRDLDQVMLDRGPKTDAFGERK